MPKRYVFYMCALLFLPGGVASNVSMKEGVLGGMVAFAAVSVYVALLISAFEGIRFLTVRFIFPKAPTSGQLPQALDALIDPDSK